MKGDVIGSKAINEEVRVVISALHPELSRLATFRHHPCQGLGLEQV